MAKKFERFASKEPETKKTTDAPSFGKLSNKDYLAATVPTFANQLSDREVEVLRGYVKTAPVGSQTKLSDVMTVDEVRLGLGASESEFEGLDREGEALYFKEMITTYGQIVDGQQDRLPMGGCMLLVLAGMFLFVVVGLASA